jgi:hypothetical protein
MQRKEEEKTKKGCNVIRSVVASIPQRAPKKNKQKTSPEAQRIINTHTQTHT